METNQKELKRVTPEQRAQYLKDMTESLDILKIQVEIAESRMRIKKANLEELMYTLKENEVANPEPQAKTTGSPVYNMSATGTATSGTSGT